MLWNATQMCIVIMKPMHVCVVFGSVRISDGERDVVTVTMQCIVLSLVRLISSFDWMNFTQTAQRWAMILGAL